MKELSLQLYSVKDVFEDTSKVQENFEKIAEMGYTGVEFAGFYGLPKEEMKKILDRTGLKAVSAHAGDICGKEDYYMDYLSYVGAKYIICPWADVDTLDKVKSLAESFNKTGKILSENGFTFGFHNHAHEFTTKYEGVSAWDILFKLTDPKYVTAQIDTFHVVKAGEDLYQTIEKYNDRMPTIHLKEITADKKDMYAGGGIIDFKKVIDMTNKPNMQYIYEFEGENAMENCEKAAAYLLSL